MKYSKGNHLRLDFAAKNVNMTFSAESVKGCLPALNTIKTRSPLAHNHMSKAADIAKVSTLGSFHALWGLVISTLISAVGTIFIARLLGSDLYGLYTIVLIAPQMLVLFRGWGVNQAIIRFSAQYRAEGRTAEVRSIFVSGLIFELATGLILFIILFALSGFFAATVFNRPALTPLIQIASTYILTGSLITVATCAFTGTEKLEYNSIMTICQALIKTLLTIALVIIGYSVAGAVIGFTIAPFTAGLIGLLLMWKIYRKLPKPISLKLETKEYIKEMLRFGLPLSFSLILGGILTQFYSFLLPIHYVTDNTVIGNYHIALNFVVLIAFFAAPITTVLFPAFSKLQYPKDKETLKNAYQFSIKYASLLVVPVALLVMSLAEPAVFTLFGTTYQTAPLFLSLLAVTYLYTAFGHLSATNLINSQGQTKVVFKLSLLTAIIGFPMGTIIILQFGVLGLLITQLTAGLPSLFASLIWIQKNYHLTVDWKSSAKIILSSALTATVTYAIIAQLHYASWIRLLLGVLIFFLTLVPTMLFTRAVTRNDINNLRSMIGGLGKLGKLVNKTLNILEKLMTTLKL